MNATHNALANGSPANATIGRAIRLVLINVLGRIPGELDRSTLGHAGKYTLCVAEDEEDSPWLSLAEERGTPDDLLVVAAGGPAGGFGAVLPPWYGNRSRAVTKGIGVCIDC